VNLIALLCCCHLVANFLQPLDSPWPWDSQYSHAKRCGPWVQLPPGDLLHSKQLWTAYNRPNAQLTVISQKRESQCLSHLSFFLVRLTVMISSLLRKDHCHYSLRTVTNNIKTLCSLCENIYKKKIPCIRTFQARVMPKLTKGGISWELTLQMEFLWK
jgi:hypothetical protein